jgi:hypothetical protein
MKSSILGAAILALTVPHLCFAVAPTENKITNQLDALTEKHPGIPIRIKSGEAIITKSSFRPPIEITLEAKTNSTNLRMAYAANQVIFNWEGNPMELRVDGGPADGHHKLGAGKIPVNTYVTIRWVVTPTMQRIYVDNDLRFEHIGDYSKIDNPISVFAAGGSVVSVKALTTQLPSEKEQSTPAKP